MSKVAYKKGTKVKLAVATLLNNTGKTRNNRPSDYNFVRDVAVFGNKYGYITTGQMRILGCMYNRVMKSMGSRATSWRNLGN